jgi:hypothetical protein
MFTGLADHTGEPFAKPPLITNQTFYISDFGFRAGRYETWHNTHEKSEETMSQLQIVPDILDDFRITGILSVWYLQKTGSASFLHVPAGDGSRITTSNCRDRPKVFFAGAMAASPCLHTLIMLSPDHMPGQANLHWLVANIPNAEVADGEQLVPYRCPDESYDKRPKAARSTPPLSLSPPPPPQKKFLPGPPASTELIALAHPFPVILFYSFYCTIPLRRQIIIPTTCVNTHTQVHLLGVQAEHLCTINPRLGPD